MAENKQNSETGNTASANDNKTATGSGGSAASTGRAKEGNSSDNKTTNPTNSGVGKTAQTGSSSSGQQSGGQSSGNVTDAAKNTLNAVKESAGTVATEAIGQAKEKATSVIGEQKATLASGINTVADSIRQVGENLSNSSDNNQVAALASKYGETLAGQIEKFSSYIDEKELRELARDVEQFARRQPLLFVGGAFALGILAARFLKSSGRRQSSGKRSRNNG